MPDPDTPPSISEQPSVGETASDGGRDEEGVDAGAVKRAQSVFS